MKSTNRLWLLIFLVATLFIGVMPMLAQDEDVPSQIDFVLASLSQGVREDVTVDDLAGYTWEQRDFPDASLGCPSEEMYAQVITPGYQFTLMYDGMTYDYRVSDDGEQVVLCDSFPTVPQDPTATPTSETPVETCEDGYTVTEGEILIDIADTCNTTVAAIMAANPDIPNPSLIYSGQTLVIPEMDGQRFVSIRPESGAPGTTVTVYASGFPPGSQVQLGIGPPESEYNVVANREIGASGQLNTTVQISPQIVPPNERVVVVVLNGDVTVSEVFSVTQPQQDTPVPTPTDPADEFTFETDFYLVALGDAGRSGNPIGCDDSLVAVTVEFAPDISPMMASLQQLFSIDTRVYGQSGLYNALYQSDLSVESLDIVDGVATINLSGTIRTGGVCDEPRLIAQIEQIALQYPSIDNVTVLVNGTPLADSLR